VQPLSDLSSSTVGEIGRLLASAEMLSRGIAVSRPEVDIGFDLVSHYEDRACRIQVKAKTSMNPPSKVGHPGSAFFIGGGRASRNGKGKRTGSDRYRDIGVDAFIFVRIVGNADFWVVPTSELKAKWTFALRDDSEWRDAWHVLTGGQAGAA